MILRIDQGYTQKVKTAISIPDKIFEAAERTAKRLGITRSELYSKAVSGYIETYLSEHITDKLNEVYLSEESSVDQKIQEMQRISLTKEDW